MTRSLQDYELMTDQIDRESLILVKQQKQKLVQVEKVLQEAVERNRYLETKSIQDQQTITALVANVKQLEGETYELRSKTLQEVGGRVTQLSELTAAQQQTIERLKAQCAVTESQASQSYIELSQQLQKQVNENQTLLFDNEVLARIAVREQSKAERATTVIVDLADSLYRSCEKLKKAVKDNEWLRCQLEKYCGQDNEVFQTLKSRAVAKLKAIGLASRFIHFLSAARPALKAPSFASQMSADRLLELNSDAVRRQVKQSPSIMRPRQINGPVLTTFRALVESLQQMKQKMQNTQQLQAISTRDQTMQLSKLAQTEAELASKRSELDLTRTELQNLSRKFDSQNETLSKLSAKLNQLENVHGEQVADDTQQINGLSELNRQQQEQISVLSTALQEKERELLFVRRDLERAGVQLKMRDNELGAARGVVEAVAGEQLLEEKRARIRELEARMKGM